MWVVGDNLLNETVPIFMNWRNNTGKQNYINKSYEVTPYTVSETNNFLIQIQKGLARAINANNYLPDVLLIVMSNIIPGDRILALQDEFYLKKVMATIRETITRRTDQLPKKARAIFETKIVMTKALPRPEDQDFKVRRRYNKQMDILGKQFDIEMIHINDILPSDQSMFVGPDLSDLAKRKFWIVVSEKIKTLDISDKEAVNKRRSERRTGETDSNGNTWLWLNTRERRNHRDYLGIEINTQGFQRPQQQNFDLNRHQRQHRRMMDRMRQLNRQAIIQQHIERRSRLGRNGLAEWNNVMNFINNMERMPGERMDEFQTRTSQVFNKRANNMLQSGDGIHMSLFNSNRRRNNHH